MAKILMQTLDYTKIVNIQNPTLQSMEGCVCVCVCVCACVCVWGGWYGILWQGGSQGRGGGKCKSIAN